jgi:hypothetical protein
VPPPPPLRKKKAEKLRITLDSDDEKADLSAMKLAKKTKVNFLERFEAVLPMAEFDFKQLLIAPQSKGEGDLYLKLLYGESPAQARFPDWVQVNAPLELSKYSKKDKPEVHVAIELDADMQSFFDRLNVRAWKLFCKTGGEAGWVPPYDAEALKPSREAAGSVPTVTVKIDMRTGWCPHIIVTEEEADGEVLVLAQGSGMEFFNEYAPLFQNVRVRGAISLDSLYEMNGRAGVTRPRFVHTLFIDKLPVKKVVEVAPKVQAKMSRADILAALRK